jgi:uncharacterized membrane protein
VILAGAFGATASPGPERPAGASDLEGWPPMPSHPAAADAREDQPGVERLLALSDGVVAIALTLLVLQLRVPSAAQVTDPASATELATQLGRGADQLVSYVISYYVIAQFWLVHHRVFRHIAGQREGLAWWNFAFLLTITLMPFTSALLGAYSGNPLAVDIFGLNLLLANLATQATLVFGRRQGLLTSQTTALDARAARVRSGASILVIALSIGVAWVSTGTAKYCWLLLAVAPWAAQRWFAPGRSQHDPVAGGTEVER